MSKTHQNSGLVFSSLVNPVVMYVKVLMTLFLVLIHLKLKFFTERDFNSHCKLLNLLNSNTVLVNFSKIPMNSQKWV